MELTTEQALQQGVIAQQEGNLQEAERLYRLILQTQPQHPDANHNLGILLVSSNQAEAALLLFKTALEANPKIGQFWVSYIGALIKEQYFAEAKQAISDAETAGVVADKLDVLMAQLISTVDSKVPPQAQLNGLLKYYQAGQYLDAETLATSITEEFPGHPFGWKVLGAILAQTGRTSEALNANIKTVQLSSQDAAAHSNLGITYQKVGRLDEAEVSYRQAIMLEPDLAEAHYNLGSAIKELGRLDDAAASYRQAIVLRPDYAEACYNLGNVLQELGRLDEAEASYRQAATMKLDYFLAYNNLGGVLKELGRLDEAEENLRRAIALKPDYAEGHYNLGVTLQELGRLHDSEASLKQAIGLKSDYAAAFWNLYGLEKTIQCAERWIDKCLKADPNYVEAKLTKAALRFYQGDKIHFDKLMDSEFKQHSWMRSFFWTFSLPNLPELHFNRWHFFDAIIEQSVRSRPFYEFGVWRGNTFRYLIQTFKKGYGFDTFTGLPEDWDIGRSVEKAGSYSADGNVPIIEGGKFIVGKFEDTLPDFYSEPRPIASVINFDADLYSSTICALTYSKPVIDEHTILIFDEFIMHESWEQDEFKALNEFCSINHCSYEVIAISFITKQVAVRLIGVNFSVP